MCVCVCVGRAAVVHFAKAHCWWDAAGNEERSQSEIRGSTVQHNVHVPTWECQVRHTHTHSQTLTQRHVSKSGTSLFLLYCLSFSVFLFVSLSLAHSLSLSISPVCAFTVCGEPRVWQALVFADTKDDELFCFLLSVCYKSMAFVFLSEQRCTAASQHCRRAALLQPHGSILQWSEHAWTDELDWQH